MTTLAFGEEIASVFQTYLGVDAPDPDVDLIATGLLDSLSIVGLIVELESRYSVKIPLYRLTPERIRTVRALQGLIQEAQTDAVALASSSLFVLRQGTGRPIFVSHTSWGSAQSAAPLARALTTGRPIYGLQAAYYQPDAQPPADLEAMATLYVQEVRAAQPEGPYSLAGHSFGGLVAYEMARQLAEAGEDVDMLAMVDTQVHRAALGFFSTLAFWYGVFLWRLEQAREDPARILRYLKNPKGRVEQHAGLNSPGVRTLPEDVRRSVAISEQLGIRYWPARYEGEAILFLADGQPWNHPDPREIWSRRVKGNLQTMVIADDHKMLDGGWDVVGAVLSPLLNQTS